MSLPLPNIHAVASIVLVVATLIALTREQWRRETVALVAIAVIALTFELFPYQRADGSTVRSADFFLGFGHQALIAVCALSILGQALLRTGALEPVGRAIGYFWRQFPRLALLPTLLILMLLSALIINITVMMVMLPILLGIAIRGNLSTSRILLPAGMMTIVGGMSTTIGTSTNLLVLGASVDLGVAAFGVFDFFLPALAAGVVTAVYLWLLAPRLLPDRQAPLQSPVKRLYTAQIRLNRNSEAVGMKLTEAIERCGSNFKVEKIQRGPGVFVTPLPDVILKASDRITTTSTQEALRDIASTLGGKLYSGDVEVDATHPLAGSDQIIAEVAITPNSRLLGVRISEARLLGRYGLRLLALHRFNREEQSRSKALDNVVLRSGDVLLVQSTPERLEAIKDGSDMLVLDGSIDLPKTRKAPVAMGIMLGTIALAVSGVLPIALAALLGVLALLMSRCLSWQESMQAISLQLVMVVVASLALSSALMATGAAVWLAQLIASVVGDVSPLVLVAGVMLGMAILANLITNYAAAIVAVPVAISLSQQYMLPAEPLVLAILFGANLSFAAPGVYKTNLLVMNAGGYRFNDFVRVGVPLMVILWLVLSALLAYAYRI